MPEQTHRAAFRAIYGYDPTPDTPETNDPINPNHYKRYRLEMIDNMQNSMTHDEFIGWLKGNVMKYISRFQDKNGLTDLEKAKWYLNKLAEVVADAEKSETMDE